MKLAVVFLFLLGLLFFFFQFSMIMRTRTARGKSLPGLEGAYGEAVAGGGRVLFYFHSPSCRMCVPMGPVIDDLARDFSRVFKINAMDEPEVARAFGVMATPATVLVEGGVVRKFLLGPQPEGKLRRWLEAGR